MAYLQPMTVTETVNQYRLQIPYVPILVEVIKRIPSRRFCYDTKSWIVSKADKDYVDKYTAWAKSAGYVSVVKFYNDIDKGGEIDYTLPEMSDLSVDHGLLIEPYEYQREGINYSLTNKRVIMGDQPGLGKTLQAIGTVFMAKSFPSLVICPASLKVNWLREFKKFAGVECVILDDKNKDCWQNYYAMGVADVFIVNYESLKKFFIQDVKRQKRLTMKSLEFDQRVRLFKSVIIDESHKCKNGKTQQAKITEGICRGKEYILALTGTPVVNNNNDLIQQLKILERLEDFGGYKKYVDRYCQGYTRSSHVKELNWKLWNTCFFRREKSKVLAQLPDKIRQYLQVEITTRLEYQKAERDLIQYLKQYKQASDEQILKSLRGEVMVRMQILQNISARGKIEAVSEFIHNILDAGEKLILFGNLKAVIAEVKEEFPKAVTVTGSDNIAQKQEAIDKFQNDDNCKLIILNYRSGGVGITLTASSRVAFIEFPWTFAECEQAEDRAHRNGQKNAVNCYYFLGKDTIDEYMYKKIQTKKLIADGVTGTDDQTAEKIVDMAMDLFNDKI